jgi:hypothetical protein
VGAQIHTLVMKKIHWQYSSSSSILGSTLIDEMQLLRYFSLNVEI